MKCVITFKVARTYNEQGNCSIETCQMIESLNVSLERVYQRILDAKRKLNVIGDVTINFVEEE